VHRVLLSWFGFERIKAEQKIAAVQFRSIRRASHPVTQTHDWQHPPQQPRRVWSLERQTVQELAMAVAAVHVRAYGMEIWFATAIPDFAVHQFLC
jgi:hypothetical protein